MDTKLILLACLLSLSGCAGAGNEHIRKEYYETGKLKSVVEDRNSVDAFMQKDVVGQISTSTTDDNGYSHKAAGKNISLQGDSEFIKAIVAAGIEGYKASQTGGASTLLQGK